MIAQTPGKVQYFRAENEPFVPDEYKWTLRMPNRIAMRELALSYEEQVQMEVQRYLNKAVTYDYLNGSRQIDLDLTVSEAEYLNAAKDSIKQNANNVKALHERCHSLDNEV